MKDLGQITVLLDRMAKGDKMAAQELFPHIYEELRHLAIAYFRHEKPGHTLQPTALVNEAYLRLIGTGANCRSRFHFYALSAKVMQNILVDHARLALAKKRGSGVSPVSLDDALTFTTSSLDLIVAVDQAMGLLKQADPELAQLVQLRFFAGHTEEEIALMWGKSPRTIKRDWVAAKAFLVGHFKTAAAAGA